MLIEMTSPVFKEKGKTRPPIHFKDGLNVVLGKEDGENSIGKSSALLAITATSRAPMPTTTENMRLTRHACSVSCRIRSRRRWRSWAYSSPTSRKSNS